MPKSFFFAEEPLDEASLVLDWFRGLDNPPVETCTDWGLVLHFPTLGELKRTPDGSVDVEASPVVTLVLPSTRRKALWTIGEVHFRARDLRKVNPALPKIARDFEGWLSSHVLVHDHQPGREHAFTYFLEGGAQNVSDRIFALPSGLAALRRGQYFVAHMANAAMLETVCRTLRLRGVECET